MPHPLVPEHEALKEKIPYVRLGDFPTPVEPLPGLAERLGSPRLFIKRDDGSSEAYGGNKVRKLEFILGDALAKRKRETITFGYAGSNHSLAVAVFARRVGLRPVSIHIPQPNAAYVRKNLLYQLALDTEFHHYPSIRVLYVGTILVTLKCTLRAGRTPCIIPPGGSNPTGVIGMVGAVLELHQAVQAGTLPEPDWIYVPLGSCGTAAGIALGLRALGMKSRIKAVCVSSRGQSNFEVVRRLFDRAATRLQALMPSFPEVTLNQETFEISNDYIGEGYAHFTEAGMEAVRLVSESDGISLEGTYTGKAMAALVDDARAGKLADQTVLFWNTHNSVDFSDRIQGLDYHRLPKVYHCYFTEPDQPLAAGTG